MHRPGHFGLNLVLAAVPLSLIGLISGALVALGIITVAVFPDIDQRIDRLSHRGFTHTVAFAAMMGVVGCGAVAGGTFYLNTQLAELIGVSGMVGEPLWNGLLVGSGAFIGILGHIAGDIITHGGPHKCRPLWPLSSAKIALGWCYARNPLANEGLFALGVLTITFSLTRAMQAVPTL